MNEFLRLFASSSVVGDAVDDVTTVGLDVGDIVVIIIRVVLWVIGVLGVAMVIYGGVKYVMSQGDTAKTTAARNTITYAVIGIIVAILAYAIVNFVVEQIRGGGGSGGSGSGTTGTGGHASET